MTVLLRFVVVALAVYVVAEVVPGIDVRGDVVDVLVVALVLALVNLLVKPLVRLLALPFVLLTLGLFLLVVNAAVLALTAALTDRLAVDGVTSALVGGVVISAVTWLGETVLGLRGERR